MKKRNSLPGYTFLFLLLVAGILSGCSGGARANNWTYLAASDGVVYCADLQQVRALDADSGLEVWSYPEEPGSSELFYTVSLLDGEAIFVSSYQVSSGLFARPPRAVLRALSVEDGHSLWVFDEPKGEFVAPGAVGDGLLVIGNGDGNVYGLDVETGSRAWTFGTRGRVWATPLVLSGTVYVASLDHTLYALDLATGHEEWRFEAGGAIAAPPLAVGDRLYVGAFDSRLYAIDRETGEELWNFQGAGWFWGTPASDGSRIYAADVQGYVYAIDEATGEEVWHREIGEPVRMGPALSEDGSILLVAGAAENNSTLYGLDTSDGLVLWPAAGSEQGGGQLASMVVRGEVVYTTRINGPERVQAFYVDTGRLVWVYPQPEAEEQE